MAHGTPDYALTQGQQTTYQVQDLGELAARLGSPDVLERRGNVVLAEGFEEYDNRVNFFASGGTGVQYRTASFAHHGSWSQLLQTPAGANNTNQVFYSEPAIGLSNVGLEVAFMVPAGTPLRSVELFIDRYNGAFLMHNALVYRHDLSTLNYVFGGEQVLASNVPAPVNVPTWSMLKLVVDFVNNVYLRAVFNGVTYKIPAVNGGVSADARAARTDFVVKLSTLGAGAAAIYLDDLIITQNEP